MAVAGVVEVPRAAGVVAVAGVLAGVGTRVGRMTGWLGEAGVAADVLPGREAEALPAGANASVWEAMREADNGWEAALAGVSGTAAGLILSGAGDDVRIAPVFPSSGGMDEPGRGVSTVPEA